MEEQKEKGYAKPMKAFVLSLVGAFFIVIGGIGNVIPGLTEPNNTLAIPRSFRDSM